MLYKIFKMFFIILFKILNRYQVIGGDNIPKDGPVILVSNHVSNWDPLVIGCASSRQVHFLAKESLFKAPIVGLFIKAWGALPLKRGRGDREAISKSLEIIENNRVLGIFIEGTRNKKNPEKMKEPQSGAAMLALKTGAPIVPILLINSHKIFVLKKVKVFIGHPLHFNNNPDIDRKELYAKVSREIVAAIESMRK